MFSCVYLLSFPFFFCNLHFPPSFYFHSAPLLWCCFGVAVSPSLNPVSRPCEREGVRRLRHSLGCFSTLVPWAEKAPSPLQPLSLRSPDPTSWYSGFCPCLPGTVSFSSTSHSFCLTLLFPSPANKLSLFLWCATECLNLFSSKLPWIEFSLFKYWLWIGFSWLMKI